MRLEQPGWWHGTRPADRLKAVLFAPAGLLYGTAAKARFALTTPYRSALPVICIGNFTLGGAGKTPLALAVARLAREMGRRPVFLTRGYGGSLAGPHRVNTSSDSASAVGDEALLLARAAPTVLARNRPDGARAIEALGDADLIIMDDGFQNPSLAKDLALIAIDAGAGFGNGFVFPAGPLRAPLGYQIRRAHAAVLIGTGGKRIRARLKDRLPVLKAHLQPAGKAKWLKGRPVLAFTGIGRPEKFFATLRECGATLAGTATFPDHHPFTEAEAVVLMQQAAQAQATLIATEKDWVRLAAPSGPLAQLKAMTRTLPVEIAFRDDGEAALRALIAALPPAPRTPA
jgi:tetraacyldisaccharide 4'-kinase